MGRRTRRHGTRRPARGPEPEAVLLYDEEKAEHLGPEQDPKKMERIGKKEGERKKAFANKLTTRKDVVTILAMYTQKQLVPLAERLDAVEAR